MSFESGGPVRAVADIEEAIRRISNGRAIIIVLINLNSYRSIINNIPAITPSRLLERDFLYKYNIF